MKLTGETKALIGIIVVTLLVVVGAVVAFSRPPEEPKAVSKDILVSSDANTTGNPDAAVWLVEFSDYECPFCATFNPIVDQLRERHGDKLLFVYRHFPLDQHDQAIPAALAAEAAGVQGKFFDMTRLIFENQDSLGESTYQRLAEELSLDIELFQASLADKTLRDKIERDRTDGTLIGVNSTPTFFLNGIKLNLTGTQDLTAAVDAAVEAAQ